MKEKKIKALLAFLHGLETLYLLVSLFVILGRLFPPEKILGFTEMWIIVSYMVLPVLLLKNIMVGVFENKMLTSSDKMWLMVRCALYIFLTIFSYPLVVSFTQNSMCLINA
jgi:hypothetical protein